MHEGEPPPCALHATTDGPGGRRTTTRAEGGLDAAERNGASDANLRPGHEAEETALG
jgi:hypothetical protein